MFWKVFEHQYEPSREYDVESENAKQIPSFIKIGLNYFQSNSCHFCSRQFVYAAKLVHKNISIL